MRLIAPFSHAVPRATAPMSMYLSPDSEQMENEEPSEEHLRLLGVHDTEVIVDTTGTRERMIWPSSQTVPAATEPIDTHAPEAHIEKDCPSEEHLSVPSLHPSPLSLSEESWLNNADEEGVEEREAEMGVEDTFFVALTRVIVVVEVGLDLVLVDIGVGVGVASLSSSDSPVLPVLLVSSPEEAFPFAVSVTNDVSALTTSSPQFVICN